MSRRKRRIKTFQQAHFEPDHKLVMPRHVVDEVDKLSPHERDEFFRALRNRIAHLAADTRTTILHGDDHQTIAKLFIETLSTRAREGREGVDEAKSGRWLEGAAYFLPKPIREAWLGDLREKRAEMIAGGRSPRFVFWATVSQVTIGALAALKGTLKDLIVRVVMEMFKSA
jgi:hypothetical protein